MLRHCYARFIIRFFALIRCLSLPMLHGDDATRPPIASPDIFRLSQFHAVAVYGHD